MQCQCEIQVCSAEKMIWFTKGEEREEAKDFIESFKILEGELSDKPYFGGETFGLVDVALITFYRRFYSSEMLGEFSIKAQCPKIIAWAKRCLQKDTVAKSLPDQKKVYEYLVQLRNKLGLDQSNGQDCLRLLDGLVIVFVPFCTIFSLGLYHMSLLTLLETSMCMLTIDPEIYL